MKNFQKINYLLAVAIVLLSSVLFLGFKASTSLNKVTVCHTPPGNPSNCHEISVSMNALQAHLNHGDNMVCHAEGELEAYMKIMREYLEIQPNSLVAVMTDF